jgi:hypothetical protein
MQEEDFIREYNDVLNPQLIQALMDLIDNQITWKSRSDKFRKDKQFALEPFYIDLSQMINIELLNSCFDHYLNEFPILKDQGDDWTSGTTILQKTCVREGFHAFHCENLAWDTKYRALTWMIYLNDVEEGGETEFLYQSKRIKPVKNKALIWPGGFTHLHRGLPPMKGEKYILTGWFAPQQGMPKFAAVQK